MNELSNFKNYNLPDAEIIHSKAPFDFCVWQPDRTYIVLGKSNSVEKSAYIELAQIDNVEIIKRNSGGESVILSPNMIVFSIKVTSTNSIHPKSVFSIINENLIENLSNLGIKNLCSKGISDLSIGEKKILGSSIFRSQNTLFYHAVINVNEDINLISKYLKHPTKEPDYRKGRNHLDFVTSIHQEGNHLDFQLLKNTIIKSLQEIGHEFKQFI